MKNYKILILLILLMLVGLVIFYQQNTINDLEKEVMKRELVISEQDNKIKEQLTTISLLESDSLAKDSAISGLQELVESNKLSCQEAMDNLTMLGSISSETESIEILPRVFEKNTNSAPETKVVVKEIVKKEETKINVVDSKSGEKYINLRNNIIRPYK